MKDLEEVLGTITITQQNVNEGKKYGVFIGTEYELALHIGFYENMTSVASQTTPNGETTHKVPKFKYIKGVLKKATILPLVITIVKPPLSQRGSGVAGPLVKKKGFTLANVELIIDGETVEVQGEYIGSFQPVYDSGSKPEEKMIALIGEQKFYTLDTVKQGLETGQITPTTF